MEISGKRIYAKILVAFLIMLTSVLQAENTPYDFSGLGSDMKKCKHGNEKKCIEIYNIYITHNKEDVGFFYLRTACDVASRKKNEDRHNSCLKVAKRSVLKGKTREAKRYYRRSCKMGNKEACSERKLYVKNKTMVQNNKLTLAVRQ